jgi:DNA-binding NarL/FixJ family response regulator
MVAILLDRRLLGTNVKRSRVLLADDEKSVLDRVRRLLEDEFEVVGTVGDGQSLLEAAERFKPDIIVVDISMPVLSGIEAIRQLRKDNFNAKVIFLTIYQEVVFVDAALATGALGYVLKVCADTDLVVAIREALQGRSYVSPLLQE